VSGVGLGYRRSTVGNQVAGEKTHPVRPAQPVGIEAELAGQGLVENKKAGLGGGFGTPADSQLGQLSREAVVEGNAHATQPTDGHRPGL
jgi:hypothetical protein